MVNSDKHDEWKQDAQAGAEPAVLPEYTLLPPSPSVASSPSAPAASGSTSAPGAPESDNDSSETSSSSSNTSEGRRIVRGIMRGLAAIVLPPVIMTGAVLAAALAMIYGSGKMLEGIGRLIAVGPEKLYKVCVGKRAKAACKAMRGKKTRRAQADVEVGAISI
ncbi:hypothetical protein OH77DRAFT_1422197 [Trametes cingulata]|nr:hypothetical protein OH77DRAFT_1422197 [Trametes cingulata]